jgi:hypothetical protein
MMIDDSWDKDTHPQQSGVWGINFLPENKAPQAGKFRLLVLNKVFSFSFRFDGKHPRS